MGLPVETVLLVKVGLLHPVVVGLHPLELLPQLVSGRPEAVQVQVSRRHRWSSSNLLKAQERLSLSLGKIDALR